MLPIQGDHQRNLPILLLDSGPLLEPIASEPGMKNAVVIGFFWRGFPWLIRFRYVFRKYF